MALTPPHSNDDRTMVLLMPSKAGADETAETLRAQLPTEIPKDIKDRFFMALVKTGFNEEAAKTIVEKADAYGFHNAFPAALTTAEMGIYLWAWCPVLFGLDDSAEQAEDFGKVTVPDFAKSLQGKTMRFDTLCKLMGLDEHFRGRDAIAVYEDEMHAYYVSLVLERHVEVLLGKLETELAHVPAGTSQPSEDLVSRAANLTVQSIIVRDFVGAVGPGIAVIAIDHDVNLARIRKDHPNFHEVEALVRLEISIFNDLISLQKEIGTKSINVAKSMTELLRAARVTNKNVATVAKALRDAANQLGGVTEDVTSPKSASCLKNWWSEEGIIAAIDVLATIVKETEPLVRLNDDDVETAAVHVVVAFHNAVVKRIDEMISVLMREASTGPDLKILCRNVAWAFPIGVARWHLEIERYKNLVRRFNVDEENFRVTVEVNTTVPVATDPVFAVTRAKL